ncbi:MAG TPA: hypothetical protein VF705_02165 [Longimicrobium sp.]|jgi:hypothetical protein
MTDLTDVLPEALAAVGALLAADGAHVAIVVVGGASLNLLGLIGRTTQDVDVIARAVPAPGTAGGLVPPDPLPPVLVRAVARVARDFALPDDWINTVVAKQWSQGLPPWLADDLEWRRYGGLDVGLAGRRTLIALKLFAAVDQSPRSVHAQDLGALAPTDTELEDAAAWVVTQDASPEFPRLVQEMTEHVRAHRDR